MSRRRRRRAEPADATPRGDGHAAPASIIPDDPMREREWWEEFVVRRRGRWLRVPLAELDPPLWIRDDGTIGRGPHPDDLRFRTEKPSPILRRCPTMGRIGEIVREARALLDALDRAGQGDPRLAADERERLDALASIDAETMEGWERDERQRDADLFARDGSTLPRIECRPHPDAKGRGASPLRFHELLRFRDGIPKPRDDGSSRERLRAALVAIRVRDEPPLDAALDIPELVVAAFRSALIGREPVVRLIAPPPPV